MIKALSQLSLEGSRPLVIEEQPLDSTTDITLTKVTKIQNFRSGNDDQDNNYKDNKNYGDIQFEEAFEVTMKMMQDEGEEINLMVRKSARYLTQIRKIDFNNFDPHSAKYQILMDILEYGDLFTINFLFIYKPEIMLAMMQVVSVNDPVLASVVMLSPEAIEKNGGVIYSIFCDGIKVVNDADSHQTSDAIVRNFEIIRSSRYPDLKLVFRSHNAFFITGTGTIPNSKELQEIMNEAYFKFLEQNPTSKIKLERSFGIGINPITISLEEDKIPIGMTHRDVEYFLLEALQKLERKNSGLEKTETLETLPELLNQVETLYLSGSQKPFTQVNQFNGREGQTVTCETNYFIEKDTLIITKKIDGFTVNQEKILIFRNGMPTVELFTAVRKKYLPKTYELYNIIRKILDILGAEVGYNPLTWESVGPKGEIIRQDKIEVCKKLVSLGDSIFFTQNDILLLMDILRIPYKGGLAKPEFYSEIGKKAGSVMTVGCLDVKDMGSITACAQLKKALGFLKEKERILSLDTDQEEKNVIIEKAKREMRFTSGDYMTEIFKSLSLELASQIESGILLILGDELKFSIWDEKIGFEFAIEIFDLLKQYGIWGRVSFTEHSNEKGCDKDDQSCHEILGNRLMETAEAGCNPAKILERRLDLVLQGINSRVENNIITKVQGATLHKIYMNLKIIAFSCSLNGKIMVNFAKIEELGIIEISEIIDLETGLIKSKSPFIDFLEKKGLGRLTNIKQEKVA